MRVCQIVLAHPQDNYTMRHTLFILVITICCNTAMSIGVQDSVPKFLDSLVVSANRYSSPIKSIGMQGVSMDMDFMHRMPKILGNADPMRYTQLLPGVQTNNEYDAGLHIHGCENSHNLISIADVPIYNAAHMLGLFSTFNASHFSKMSVKKQITAEDAISRIGGVMNMVHSDTVPEKTNGEFSVGLMSSQGTIRVPINEKSALFASLRLSYLNLLYGSLLEIDGSKLEYSFSDLNLTYLNNINKNHRLYIDFYTGNDNATLKDKNSELYYNTTMRWGNMLAAAHWEYEKDNNKVKQSIYYTGYYNRMQMRGKYDFRLPSGIYDFGYKIDAKIDNIDFGINVIKHHISPQAPEIDSYNIHKNSVRQQQAIELSGYAQYVGKITDNISYDIAIKGDYYHNSEESYSYSSLNPSASLTYKEAYLGELYFLYTKQHQYLLNCGFTNIGFPVEFWFGSNKKNRPQIAHNLQLIYKRDLLESKYTIDLELYYKKLYNQIEYNSSPLDLLNTEYNLNNNLLHGKGYNYGVNISINKCSGRLTGWLAYSYGRALRKFDTLGDKWFPANHERVHELNSVVAYRINKKMDIGANLIFASGTPFTVPKYFYIINGNVITEFDEHNAARLKPYMRLDLSFNYDIVNTDDKTSGINISLYNALFMSNSLYYRFKVYEGGYALRGVAFLSRILPSISYYYKF